MIDLLSVVVPAHDEAENLSRLLSEVHSALDPSGVEWELIVVDDGSTDATPTVLAHLAAADPRLRPLRLEQRSGQTAALVAGFRAARGPRIATLDADLQCSPADLPALLDTLGDADLACGIRGPRNDPLSRRVASALSNLARRVVLAPHVRDLACPLRVFRAAALARVEATTPFFDGAHRWLPALFTLAGLRIVQRPVAHHPRTAGVSKYNTRGRVVPVLEELGRVLVVAARQSRGLRVAGGLALLALAMLPFVYALGRWPLMEPDEGRNAEVAREMLAGGAWSVPHFNGLPYLDKPVLLFWMIAGVFRVAGVGEAAARFPSALAAVVTVALTFDLARMLVGRRRALLAAAIVATAPIVLAYARLVIFDLPLTALVTATLCCLVRARLHGRPWRWLPLAGLTMGLAVLMKGPVGIAVPLLAWAAGRGALPPPVERSGAGPVVAAALVVAAVVVPWLALVLRQEPTFLRYALLDETFLRLSSADRFHRGAPVWFYLETLAWALGVWGVLLAAQAPALVRRWRAGGADAAAIAFATRAVAALLIFFSLSASKRAHYILPALVPLALLAAIAIATDVRRTAVVLRVFARWAALAGGIALVAALAGVHGRGSGFGAVSATVLSATGIYLLVWGPVTAFGGRRPAVALACAALLAPGLGLVLLGPLTPYAEGRSSRELASWVPPGAEVVLFDTFRTALPFYLGRPVVLASDTGRALTSNWVIARRPTFKDSIHLVPTGAVVRLLAEGRDPYVVASRWNAGELTQRVARPLVALHSDEHSILFRPRG